MCGFAALFEPGRLFAAHLLDDMDQDLFHRGPDSGGRLSEPGAALVFRRLSILDVAVRANQPMIDSRGRYAIVFNGEIYNFLELRRALQSKGVDMRTSGDTEVILEGFSRWGEVIVDRLEGMFAFVIWDRHAGNVFAARDPFGIKPLYVARRGDLTAFASEMRPLRRLVGTEVDELAFAELLLHRYAAGRLSNLKRIELVPGGGMIHIAGDGTSTERLFFDVLSMIAPDPGGSPEDASEVVADVVSESVRDHLQSDVGYAVQLSGGVDSSLLTALAVQRTKGRLRTYGIDLGAIHENERRWRDKVIERYDVDHHEIALNGRSFADAFPQAVHAMEGPLPHLGCVMLMLLCRRIRETDKVVLTGEGADEMFGGYARYGVWRTLARHARFASVVPNSLWPLLGRYRWLRRYETFEAASVASVYFDATRISDLFPDFAPKPGARETAARRFSDFRDRMTAVDQTAYLASLLMRQDKMSMAASVEARVPFTHVPLARAVNRLSRDIRVPGRETKPLLKRMARTWLPTEIVDRRKVGLNLPYDTWLRDSTGLGRYLELLTEPQSALADWGDRREICRHVDRFRAGHNVPGAVPVVHLVNLELWLRSMRDPSLAAEDA